MRRLSGNAADWTKDVVGVKDPSVLLERVRALHVRVQSDEGRVVVVGSHKGDLDDYDAGDDVDDAFLYVMDLHSGRKSLPRFKIPLGLTSAISCRGDTCVVAELREEQPLLRVLDLAGGNIMGEIRGGEFPTSICFVSQDQVHVASSSSLCAIDLMTGRSVPLGPTVQDCCAFFSRGNLVCTASAHDDTLSVWDTRTAPRPISKYWPQGDALEGGFSHGNIGHGHIRNVALTNDGAVIANAAQHSGFFLRWDFVHSKQTFRKGGATRCFWADDAKWATSGHYGGCCVSRTSDLVSVSQECSKFHVSPGPVSLHFDHSSLVVGAASSTHEGCGTGVYLWSSLIPRGAVANL
jgi:hypothetical protein